MTEYVISLIRTYMPIAAGWVLTQLALIGIEVAPEHEVSLAAALTAILAGAYYAIARWLEQRFSWAKYLLGTSKQPHYEAPDPITEKEYEALKAHNETFNR